jgi:sugar/nucleoside kinase (ribokinase family)
LNREEAIKFIDYPVKPTDTEVMKKMFLFGPKIIVVTNGKEGAKAYDGHNFYHIDAFNSIRKVDATGAGDSFATGFSGKLISEGWRGENNSELIVEALKWGVVNSSSVLGYVGAQKGLLNSSEIEKEAKTRRFEISIKI